MEEEKGEEERKPPHRNETQSSKGAPVCGMSSRTPGAVLLGEKQNVVLALHGLVVQSSQVRPTGGDQSSDVPLSAPAPVTQGPTCRGHLMPSPSELTFSPPGPMSHSPELLRKQIHGGCGHGRTTGQNGRGATNLSVFLHRARNPFKHKPRFLLAPGCCRCHSHLL